MAETAGYERFFPYDDPYPNQREAMDRIANALERGQDVLAFPSAASCQSDG